MAGADAEHRDGIAVKTVFGRDFKGLIQVGIDHARSHNAQPAGLIRQV